MLIFRTTIVSLGPPQNPVRLDMAHRSITPTKLSSSKPLVRLIGTQGLLLVFLDGLGVTRNPSNKRIFRDPGGVVRDLRELDSLRYSLLLALILGTLPRQHWRKDRGVLADSEVPATPD